MYSSLLKGVDEPEVAERSKTRMGGEGETMSPSSLERFEISRNGLSNLNVAVPEGEAGTSVPKMKQEEEESVISSGGMPATDSDSAFLCSSQSSTPERRNRKRERELQNPRGPNHEKKRKRIVKTTNRKRDAAGLVGQSVADAVQELRGAADAEKEFEFEPLPEVSLPALKIFFDRLRQTSVAEGHVAGSFYFRGSGLWYSTWASRGWMPYDPLNGRLVWVSALPPGPRQGALWFGPRIFGLSDSIVTLWDQNFFCPDYDLVRNWLPLVETDDFCLYERARSDDNFPGYSERYVRTSWSAKDFDVHSVLLTGVQRPTYSGMVDTWAAQCAAPRNAPHTVESLIKFCQQANNAFVWSGGPTYMPILLQHGMLKEIQDVSGHTLRATTAGASYSEDAWHNFGVALPSRFFNLTSGLIGTGGRAAQSFQGLVERGIEAAAAALEKDEEELNPDNFDDGGPSTGGGADDEDDDGSDITSYKEAARNILTDLRKAIDATKMPSIGIPGVLPSSIIGGVKMFTPENVDSDDQSQHTSRFQTFLKNMEFALQVPATGEAVPLERPAVMTPLNATSFGDSYLAGDDVADAVAKVSAMPSRLGWKWRKAMLADLQKVEEENRTRLYNVWRFSWPIYCPANTHFLSAATCVARLGEAPKYRPRHKAPIRLVDGTPFHNWEQILSGFDPDNERLGLDSSLCVSSRGNVDLVHSWEVWVEQPLREQAIRDMKRSSAYRRNDQFSEMSNPIAPRGIFGDGTKYSFPLERQKIFRKTDELLLNPKPRLIHDCTGKQFWLVRSMLQFIQSDLKKNPMISVVGKPWVSLTYGGCMDPDGKSRWKMDVVKRRRASSGLTYDILVGGDDIFILVSENGLEVRNIEIDMSKCDTSQSKESFKIFSHFMVAYFGISSDDLFLKVIEDNMVADTVYYIGRDHLHTGTPETTLFNSITIGWTLFLIYFRGLSLDDALIKAGYSAKISVVPAHMGTFHKGFWNLLNIWLPLPSRIVKFGWWKRTGGEDFDAGLYGRHIAGVAKGWRSMNLDPLFGRFIDSVLSDPLCQIASSRRTEEGDDWKKEAWAGWNWDRCARNSGIEEVAQFYEFHYGVDVFELREFDQFLAANVRVHPTYFSAPLLTRLYVRDYRCDTQKDYDQWCLDQGLSYGGRD